MAGEFQETKYIIKNVKVDTVSTPVQVVLDSTTTDYTKQLPGVDETLPDLITITSKRNEDLDSTTYTPRDKTFLWAYKGIRLELDYINIDRRYSEEVYDHLLEVFLTDSDNFVEESGGNIQGWCNLNRERAMIFRRVAYNSWSGYSGRFLGHDGSKFHFSHYAGYGHSVIDLPYNSYDNIHIDSRALLHNADGGAHCHGNNECGWTGEHLNSSMMDWSDDLQSGSEYLIIVLRIGGDAEEVGWRNYDRRDRGYYVLKIPKVMLRPLVEESNYQYLEYRWGGPGHTKYVSTSNQTLHSYPPSSVGTHYEDAYGDDDDGGIFGDDKRASAWTLNNMRVKVYGPDDYHIDEFPSGADIAYEMNYPIWNDSSNAHNFNPSNAIDYLTLRDYDFQQTDMTDFRPISHIYTKSSILGLVNTQAYYNQTEPEYKRASAPTIAYLNFDVSDSYTVGPNYYEDYDWYPETPVTGFRYFVVRWGDEDDITDFDESTFPEIANQIQAEMDNFKNSATVYSNWTDKDLYIHNNIEEEAITHQYTNGGVRNIYAVVYSYIDYPDNSDFSMALSWKIVKITFFLTDTLSLFLDFPEMGAENYHVLPWPYQDSIPIISGFEFDSSSYFKSVEGVYVGGEFKEYGIDALDYRTVRAALENDQMGNFIGKIDLGQTRVFTAPYDMHELLMINQELTIIDGVAEADWHPYWDDAYWYGGYQFIDGYWQYVDSTKRFPRPTGEEDSDISSCIGTQYITNSPERSLRNTCIIEFNTGELDGGIIYDTTGTGNMGYTMGDYVIDKFNIDARVARQSSIDRPEKATKDKAI